MPELVQAGPVRDLTCVKEAVCIHTKKILDSCRDKDCIEDLRVYFTAAGQAIINNATGVRARSAELLYVYIDVESVPFNRGFFTVDAQYFYKITVDAFVGGTMPVPLVGLATFSKRVLLFGSEGTAKTFSSKYTAGSMTPQQLSRTSSPTAVVEAVDPVVLDIKLLEACDCRCDSELADIPNVICDYFEEPLVLGAEAKRVFVTLGQFSIIRMERDTQLLIPSFDYCIPCKDCSAVSGSSSDDPCEMFRQIKFPLDEFFPPSSCELSDDSGCGC